MKNCKKHKEPCGCKITLPVECIRWYGESTTFLPMKTNENLESILLKIEKYLQDLNPSGEVTLENIGEGQQVYKGVSTGGNHQFRTLEAGENITVTQNPNTLIISADILTPNLQQVLDSGNVANNFINLKGSDSNSIALRMAIISESILPGGITDLKSNKGQFTIWEYPSGYLDISANIYNTTTASNNVYFGGFALRSLTKAAANTSVGNTAFGTSALQNLTGGTGSNSAFGTSAGGALTTGIGNTLIGFRAGLSLTTGSNNTILGGIQSIGTSTSNNIILSDGTATVSGIGFRVLQDGTTTIPKQTNTTINADTTGKSVITKEWFNDNIPSTPDLQEVTDIGYITDNIIHIQNSPTNTFTGKLLVSTESASGSLNHNQLNFNVKNSGGTIIRQFDISTAGEPNILFQSNNKIHNIRMSSDFFNGNVTHTLQDKTGILAHLDDIPALQNLQSVTEQGSSTNISMTISNGGFLNRLTNESSWNSLGSVPTEGLFYGAGHGLAEQGLFIAHGSTGVTANKNVIRSAPITGGNTYIQTLQSKSGTLAHLSDLNYVSTQVQSLTLLEQAQARENIGITTSFYDQKWIWDEATNPTKEFELDFTPTQIVWTYNTNTPIWMDESDFEITGTTLTILTTAIENGAIIRIGYYHE